MSLSLDQVSYRYPGTNVGLSDVSFSVAEGELLAVIGPSGSGKSTLLKLIAGLELGHSGTISLGGRNLSAVPVHQRNIGVVFQSYALFPHLNVRDNIAYGLKLRKVPEPERRKRSGDLLDIIGMAEYADRSVAQLSGGQQQRVALARALAINPSALLLDEPLAALDASIRGHLRDQIREVQRRFNATTLLVTHDQEEALSMAQRVAVLVDGRVVQLATPRQLYEEPATCAVARFVGLSTLFEVTVVNQDRIDLGFCVLAAPTGHRTPGTRVFALVRPEHVQADPAPQAVNRLVGQPGMQRYLGSVVRYDFQIAGAPLPVLVESRTVASEAIAIPPEHLRLLDL
jgi:putative spermidine/putrescine transport system ATP-binding protein